MRQTSKRETRARRNRAWREVSEIVGSLDGLPAFFRNGLYSLTRAGLSDAEIRRAFERCRAWVARVKDGVGECECGCGTKRPVDAKNAQGQSVWCMDHDSQRKMFRGVLYQKCNTELGDGAADRKMAHASYALAHGARLPDEAVFVRDANEFGAAGAVLD